MKNIVFILILLSFGCSSWAGKISEEQLEFAKKKERVLNAVPPEEALLNTDAEPDLSEGFVSLYNGENLEGWKAIGGFCTFEPRGEEIVGTTVRKSPSTYLCTTKNDYKNFIFTLEYKWEVDGNGGIMFRAAHKPGKKKYLTVYGPQIEIEGDHAMDGKRGWTGGVYGQEAGKWLYPLWLDAHQEVRQARKVGEWNRVTLFAKGSTIKTWVNGIPAACFQTEEFLEGFIGLQVHSGKRGTVLYRNIKIKELD